MKKHNTIIAIVEIISTNLLFSHFFESLKNIISFNTSHNADMIHIANDTIATITYHSHIIQIYLYKPNTLLNSFCPTTKQSLQ